MKDPAASLCILKLGNEIYIYTGNVVFVGRERRAIYLTSDGRALHGAVMYEGMYELL